MLKIGVLGAYRGKSMIDVLMVYREAELVAICDKFQPALEKVKKQAENMGLNNISYYNNFEDFLKHDMDAVVLANYATEHATFAVKCLRAGMHVMSEVLPCETMAQAVELIEAVEESGLVYSYAENYCYMQDTFEMWKKYETGELGDVVYAEGEYIHDCTSCWPQITYGDKNHWRNLMHPNFYCTHSLGPIMTITGRRPVKVVGYETPPVKENILKTGRVGGAGIEVVTLDNGAVVKSMHGAFIREPARNFYSVYCEKGVMESGSDKEGRALNIYMQEKGRFCVGEWERYTPVNEIQNETASKFRTHGGSDFYSIYLFIQKILGKPDGKWSIDVYRAVDMGICGILAWRSCLNGNIPVEVPDLSKPAQREKYRNDNACTNPAVAGEQVVPKTTYAIKEAPDEVYDNVKKLWENGLDINGEADTVYSNL